MYKCIVLMSLAESDMRCDPVDDCLCGSCSASLSLTFWRDLMTLMFIAYRLSEL